MSFRKKKSRKHVVLPIVGHTLTGIATHALVTLQFTSPAGVRSDLRFEHDVIIDGPDEGESQVIKSTKPGSQFDPAAAYDMLASLLQKTASSALAHSDGQLEITFEDQTRLSVQPENYEAWHFQQPAPLTGAHNAKDPYFLTGYGGGLI